MIAQIPVQCTQDIRMLPSTLTGFRTDRDGEFFAMVPGTTTTTFASRALRSQRRRLHHPRRAQAGSLRIPNIPPAQDHRASGNVVRDITNLVTRATCANPRRAVLLAFDVRRVAMRGGLRRLSASFHATTTYLRMVNIREELSRKDRVHGSARQDTTNLVIRALRAKRRAHRDNFWEANRARQEAHTIPGHAQAARRRVLLANISRDAVAPIKDPAQRVLHVVLANIGRDAPVRILVVAQAVPPTRVALGNIWTAAVASALEHARVVRHAEQTNSDPTAVAQARACANRAIRRCVPQANIYLVARGRRKEAAKSAQICRQMPASHRLVV